MDKQYYENVNKLNSISSLQNHMNDQMSSFADNFNEYCKDYVEFESKCLNQLDEINNRIHKEHKSIADYLEVKEERERDKIRSIVNSINTNTNKMKNKIINRVNANTNFAKNQMINELNQVLDNNKKDIIFEMGDVLDQINDNIDTARAENLNEFNVTRNQMQNEFATSRDNTQIGFHSVNDLIENLKRSSEEAHSVITKKIDINKDMLWFLNNDLHDAENSLYNHIQNIINEINNRMGTINLISNTIRNAAEQIDNFIHNNVPGLIEKMDSTINALNLNVYHINDYHGYVQGHLEIQDTLVQRITDVGKELNKIAKGVDYIDTLAKRITWLEEQMGDQEKYAKDYKSILNQLQALERECSRPQTIIENNRTYNTNINFNTVFNTIKNVSFYLGGIFNREREGNRQIEDENNPVSIEYPSDENENERSQPQEPLLLRNGTPQNSQQNTPISTYIRQNVKVNANAHVSPISTPSYYSSNSHQSSPGYSMFNRYNSPGGYNSLSGYNSPSGYNNPGGYSSRPLFPSHDELRQRRPSNNAGEEYYADY